MTCKERLEREIVYDESGFGSGAGSGVGIGSGLMGAVEEEDLVRENERKLRRYKAVIVRVVEAIGLGHGKD